MRNSFVEEYDDMIWSIKSISFNKNKGNCK